MAVSKRLRFEILRRDNFTCYYCGLKPPETELKVDHVLPVALGGKDEASNLVAACHDCNSGKTSIAPDSPLVASVDTDAIRWAAAMQAAIDKASNDHEAIRTYREEFYNAWHSYSRPMPMDENWRTSVENFRTRGLPIEILTDAAHRAIGAQQIKPDNKFKYACGIAWNRTREIEATALSIFKGASQATEDPAAPIDERTKKNLEVFKILYVVWKWAWERELDHEAIATEDWHRFTDTTSDLLRDGASAKYDLVEAAYQAGRDTCPELAPYLGTVEAPF